MDLPSIKTAISSTKAAVGLLKEIISLNKNSEIKQKIIELQNVMLELQAGMLEMQEEYQKNNAENEPVNDWEKVIKAYELEQVSNGVFLYGSKGEKNKHYICPNCYEERQKSIIQKQGDTYSCVRCKNTIFLNE